MINPAKHTSDQPGNFIVSAISAIFSFDGVNEGEIDTMLESLKQIPHDAAGSWRSGPFVLAASTLHTTAESREQDQPCVSEDGKLAIVFDGYLLNHLELHADLSLLGQKVRNLSDAEIALHCYEAWGDNFADRLQGEFSLIIADARRGRLLAARDHLGFAPLYYRLDGSRLIIASDFRTISALTRAPMEPNLRYLSQIITNRWYLRDETPWREVNRVKRAHTLVFDGQRLSQPRYWTPPADITIRYKSDAEYAEHYREVLFDCVRRSSRSDREVGIAVSGGLDSSSIFSIADALERSGKFLAPGFRGYSLAAAEGSNAFELPYARAAAAHVGRELVERPLFDPEIDWYTQDAQWHRDIPTPSNGAMMLDMEQQVVADGARVFINGSGGDKWLQGHENCYGEYLDEFDLAGFGRTLKEEIGAFGLRSAGLQCLRQTVAWAAPKGVRRVIRRRLRERRRKQDISFGWLAPELRIALKEAEELYEATLPEDPIEWAKQNLATSPRGDLTHAVMRRQRAKIGLESRHPMLSRAFMEFSLQTPAHIKRRGNVTKVIHRAAMEPFLPAKVLNRTTKANFTNEKIDSQFADYVRRHAPERLQDLCDLRGLEPLLAIDFSSPEGDYWAWEIWGLYAAAAFLYQYKYVTEINPATGVQQDRN